MNKTCMGCGTDYDYDPSKALGASADRCAKCRKADSARNKKIILLEVAGNGFMECRICGYRTCVSALHLVDAVNPLTTPTTPEEKLAFARKQYILCANCLAEIKEGKVKSKVLDSSCYPVKVEFFTEVVTVVVSKIESRKYSTDLVDVEVTREEPKTTRDFREKAEPARIETVDVSIVQD